MEAGSNAFSKKIETYNITKNSCPMLSVVDCLRVATQKVELTTEDASVCSMHSINLCKSLCARKIRLPLHFAAEVWLMEGVGVEGVRWLDTSVMSTMFFASFVFVTKGKICLGEGDIQYRRSKSERAILWATTCLGVGRRY